MKRGCDAISDKVVFDYDAGVVRCIVMTQLAIRGNNWTHSIEHSFLSFQHFFSRILELHTQFNGVALFNRTLNF